MTRACTYKAVTGLLLSVVDVGAVPEGSHCYCVNPRSSVNFQATLRSTHSRQTAVVVSSDFPTASVNDIFAHALALAHWSRCPVVCLGERISVSFSVCVLLLFVRLLVLWEFWFVC